MSSLVQGVPQTGAQTQPQQGRAIPGFSRFVKVPDFSNTAATTSCFNLENYVRALAVPVVGEQQDTIPVMPVFLVDPCQNGFSPILTESVLPTENTSVSFGSKTATGAFTHRWISQSGVGSPAVPGSIGIDYVLSAAVNTSGVNSANVVVIELRGILQLLAIHMAASGGTTTLKIEASVDNATWLQIDLDAAALTTDHQYTLATNALNGAAQAATVAGTGASTVKLNPLAFRYVRITAAAIVGQTTTLTITAK